MEERYHVTIQNRFYPDMSNVLVNKKILSPMEERYHVTIQNRFYPDMSNVLVNKKYYSGGKTYQPIYIF